MTDKHIMENRFELIERIRAENPGIKDSDLKADMKAMAGLSKQQADETFTAWKKSRRHNVWGKIEIPFRW